MRWIYKKKKKSSLVRRDTAIIHIIVLGLEAKSLGFCRQELALRVARPVLDPHEISVVPLEP